MADVRDGERPVDRFVCDVDGPRAAGKDGPRVLDGEVLLKQRANEAGGGFSILTRLEVRPVLGPRKDTALETDKGDPLTIAPGPTEGGECRELARAVLGRGGESPGHLRPIAAYVGTADPPRVDDHPLGVRGRHPRAGAGAGPAVAPTVPDVVTHSLMEAVCEPG